VANFATSSGTSSDERAWHAAIMLTLKRFFFPFRTFLRSGTAQKSSEA
jgi:hypothetical protein